MPTTNKSMMYRKKYYNDNNLNNINEKDVYINENDGNNNDYENNKNNR